MIRKEDKFVYSSTDETVSSNGPDIYMTGRKRDVFEYVLRNGPINASEIAEGLGLHQANVSAYLKTIIKSGTLKKTQCGQFVYYSVDGSIPDESTKTLPIGRTREIFDYVLKSGPCTATDLVTVFSIDRGNLSAYLNKLVKFGELKKAQQGQFVYYSVDGSIPDGGAEALPIGRTREIFDYVLKSGPCTATDLVTVFSIDRGNLSAYLNKLVKLGELKKAQQGQFVYYSVDGSISAVARPCQPQLQDKIMETSQNERKCLRCGKQSPQDVIYCPMCGANIERTKIRSIPTNVKQAVWKRDGGRCAACGATEHLHYDHIIPFSKGGGNILENVQILCATCNMRKSDRIE